ncbi:MAG TPA: periplasmic heavy metal sensor [Hyphomicrobiaceae bacterium]|nr:periplasmic heavy metal sensor [Hyphomicrobiaceae bacterium]
MTNQPDNSSHPQPAAATSPPRRRRMWPLVTVVALAATLTGSIATHALSQHSFAHWHGPGLMSGPIDPARAEERIDKAARHLSIEIDATAEQQERLRTIAKAAVKDLLPMREKAHAARQRARDLLTQQSVDRAAIEAFRAEQMQLAESASRRIAQALGDAAEVLTPEQRRKIADYLQEMRERRAFWWRWHRG